jgi:conjugal transfer pilus assembly protein TraF
MVRLLFALIIMSPFSSFAEVFYEQSEQGWYWYDVNKIEGNKETNSTAPSTYEAAQKELETLRKSLDDKKALALMNPTEDNIKDYIRVQNETNKLAEVFAVNWQKVIIQNPELDHTVKNPTNAVGRRVYHEQKAIEQKSSVESLTSKYGLFFFFRSNCPYCHKFAPIMKMFEQEYGITVVPVSLDGIGLLEYPDPKSDNGIAKKLNVDVVPAVIAVDPKTGEVIPVSYGLVSIDELSYRINLLAQDEKVKK